MTPWKNGRRGGVALAAVLALAACGSGGGESGSAPVAAGPADTASSDTGSSDTGSSTTAVEQEGPARADLLPAVDVVDVSSGETVALASLLPADRPTLLWMWAPH